MYISSVTLLKVNYGYKLAHFDEKNEKKVSI